MNSPSRLRQKKGADKGCTLWRGSENQSALHTWGQQEAPSPSRVPCLEIPQIPYHHAISGGWDRSGGGGGSVGQVSHRPHLHCWHPCLAAAQRLPLRTWAWGSGPALVSTACRHRTLAKGRSPGGRAQGRYRLPAIWTRHGRWIPGLLRDPLCPPWLQPAHSSPGEAVPAALTHPPGFLHVATWQPLHKVNASQRRAGRGQQDRGVHHEVLHVHGLHLAERCHRRPQRREKGDGAGDIGPPSTPSSK